MGKCEGVSNILFELILNSEGSMETYLSSEGSMKIVENPNLTRNNIEWNSNLFENPMHDLSTISFKANQSKEETTMELAKCIMDIKGKEPMEEEDDILDRSLTTYSKNTIGVFNLCRIAQCYSL